MIVWHSSKGWKILKFSAYNCMWLKIGIKISTDCMIMGVNISQDTILKRTKQQP